MIRGGLTLAVLVTLVAVPVAQAAPQAPSAPMVVSGLGGQTAVLTVPRGGLDVAYPFFSESRLAGPDGTVGGVAIQRLTDGRLVGGLLLQNAPGFRGPVPVTLVDFEHTRLAPGRYRFTLLGQGPQVVQLGVRNSRHARRLAAAGPARPVTRVAAGTTRGAHVWADALTIRAGDYLVVGAGSGGDLQQADESQMCLQRDDPTTSGPCLPGATLGTNPGASSAGGWMTSAYPPGVLAPGAYHFVGQAVGAGAGSSGHADIVISLRH